MTQLSPLPANDVDGVLHAFFKAQMPSPWPALKTSGAVQSAKGWPMMRSRLALAASVALLALGLTFLTGAFRGRPNPSEQRILVESPTASTENNPLRHPVQPGIKIKTEEKRQR